MKVALGATLGVEELLTNVFHSFKFRSNFKRIRTKNGKYWVWGLLMLQLKILEKSVTTVF